MGPLSPGGRRLSLVLPAYNESAGIRQEVVIVRFADIHADVQRLSQVRRRVGAAEDRTVRYRGGNLRDNSLCCRKDECGRWQRATNQPRARVLISDVQGTTTVSPGFRTIFWSTRF